MCTDREMCKWLVAQLCDCIETGQIWVMTKTYALLSALLWRGSTAFVEVARMHGRSLFQPVRLASLIRSTPQENLPGTRLPCSLQPLLNASAASTGSCRAPLPPTPNPHGSTETAMEAGHGIVGGDATTAQTSPAASGVFDERFSCLIANTAYLESLCDYRMRHPTLDLAHGEIVATGTNVDISTAAAMDAGTHWPTTWKELLDDTLELMKAISATNPQGCPCPIGVAMETMRMRNAVLLYQVACRALVRLLHAVLTMQHIFVSTLQDGLQVPSSGRSPCGTPSTLSPTGSGHDYFGKDAFGHIYPDYSLTPDVMRGFLQDYYYAIYQFNRTVGIVKAYCESAQYLHAETSKRLLDVFKLLPEASIRELKLSRPAGSHPLHTPLTKLHDAAVHSAEGEGSEATNTSETASSRRATCPSPPLADEEVQLSMLEVCEYHVANRAYRERVWDHQVDAVCGLFEDAEATILQQIFRAGLSGLWEQWRDFTNNGAAAAEKALMSSNSSAKLADSSGPGVNSSDGGVTSDCSPKKLSSTIDSLTKSSTYILRSLPFSVRAKGSPNVKSDVISVNRSSLENSTESAIDALLLEDDVVVICNEECSCNDKLKLIDRFQVLMDVPLGEGSYGKVYRAWDEVVGCYLAAKELQLDASKAHNVAVREVLQEYTVLTELSHPNIVRVVAFMVLKQTARIYMEWMPSGSLQDVLRHHPRGMLRESVVRRYARDVLSGLAFLHSRGVIHRDVKPGNMLLSSDGAVKLTDFGTSLVLSGKSRTLESNAVTGTAAYMAPENMQGTQSPASDIWSFGCSLVQLISGNVPWYNPKTKALPEPIALLFKIGSLDDATHLERPHDVLKDAVQAGRVDDDLTTNPSSVPSSEVEAEEAGPKKPSSKDGVDAELLNMLDSIFVVDRKKRPSASELLQHPFFKVA
ncbi:putative protein kinase [Leptomonas pyrrhocoris]|uniref:Protein kinase domain-containing protein n=1 Tax=Leptomonas pyrrhocoris TaxID=157538 RepID=A0A0N0VDP1_LEPPY|nr:putative protein kinase [Leptomonas pyrrhocoris]KPA76124.1 putative protein kinase [Leptomonas pyrrhocoris]|eukprot:XP_015654563.1 putative protein kinase [Leptomonas pyrrhocoris]